MAPTYAIRTETRSVSCAITPSRRLPPEHDPGLSFDNFGQWVATLAGLSFVIGWAEERPVFAATLTALGEPIAFRRANGPIHILFDRGQFWTDRLLDGSGLQPSIALFALQPGALLRAFLQVSTRSYPTNMVDR